jgi:hypothetical protein
VARATNLTSHAGRCAAAEGGQGATSAVSIREKDLLSVHGSGVLVGGSALLPEEDVAAVLVLLEAGDGAVAGVDGDGDHLPVRFFFLLNFLNDDPSALAVDAGDLALAVLEGAAHDLDLVALAHGHGAHVVLLLEVLAEVAGHHDAADAAGGREVGLAGLSALAGNA